MRGVVLLLYVLAAGCHRVGGTSTSTGACRHSRTRVAAGARPRMASRYSGQNRRSRRRKPARRSAGGFTRACSGGWCT